MSMRLGFAVLLFSAALSPAWAEAALVQSSPTAGATVSALRNIKLTFSEKITAPGVQLKMADGMTVPAAASLSSDAETVSARLTAPLMAGKWTVSWYATSAGGQRSEGSYSFTVK
jgi:hypothetical protein